MEDAIYLSVICRYVTVVLRRDIFRVSKSRVDTLKARENVTILCKTHPIEIKGTNKMESVVLKDPDGTAEQSMDGVFLAVGVIPVSGWLKELPLTFADVYVDVGEDCYTGIPGLFVAGDLRKKPLRQVITAAADGANAVNSSAMWLDRI